MGLVMSQRDNRHSCAVGAMKQIQLEGCIVLNEHNTVFAQSGRL